MHHDQENLNKAGRIIREAPGRIAELRSSCAPREEIEAAENLLRHAKEVRSSMALQILCSAAEERAAELLVLDARRREIVACLQTFVDGMVSIDGQSHRLPQSRRVSAALLLGLEGPDIGAFDDARRGWQIEADRVLATEPGGTNG